MGFECGFQVVPKFDNITAKQSLASWQYYNYLNWLDTDWCKKQIKKGYEFYFEDHSTFYIDDLPSKDTLEKYKVIFNNNKLDYPESIFNLCSIGRIFDRIVKNIATTKDKHFLDSEKSYLEFTKEDLKEAVSYCARKLEEMTPIPISIVSGYKEIGEETKEIELDGIYGETLDNGELISIPINSIVEWCTNDLDFDERDLYKRVVDELNPLIDMFDFENKYLIYYRSE